MKSRVYVFLQLLILVLLVIIGDLFPKVFYMYIPWIIGFSLVIWSFVEKRMKVSIFPEPTNKMKLITTGPYKFVRHPIYTGVLLLTASWIPIDGRWELYIIAWLCLLILFLLKISHEEKMLIDSFNQYQRYQAKTDRIIPFIY